MQSSPLPARLRPLCEADLPLVRMWMRDAPEAPAWNEAELAQLARSIATTERRMRRAWAAEDATAELVGFAVATALALPNAAPECELEFLLVAPAARRRGVGRALMEAVMEWVREWQAQEVWLEVRASNLLAQQLYARCGFAAMGRRPGYYADPTEDAVLMRCRITGAPSATPL